MGEGGEVIKVHDGGRVCRRMATTDVIKWQEERRSLSENESIIKQSSLYKT